MDNNENITKDEISDITSDTTANEINSNQEGISPSVLQADDSANEDVLTTVNSDSSDNTDPDNAESTAEDDAADDAKESADSAEEQKKPRCAFCAKLADRIMDKPSEKVPKKWHQRTIPERIATMIPAIIMAVVVFIACAQNDIPGFGDIEYTLALAITAAAIFIGACSVRLGKVFGWILVSLSPALIFFLTEYFTHNPFDMKTGIIVTNLVFYYGTAFLVLFLTGSMKASVAVTAILPMIFGLVNYYTLQFRGTPLFPWDIASAGVAAGVVDNYDIVITWHVCFEICAFLFIIMLGFLCTPRIRAKLWWLRSLVSIVSALVLVLTGSFVQQHGVKTLGMYPHLFSPHTVFNRNGAAVTYAYTLQYTGVQQPSEYSVGNLESILSEYKGEVVGEDTVKPNVIVIMNEAFSDLKTFVDYKENRPVTPYINAMEEDTVKGTLHVSVKGGNTANSEFEFLTGLSMTNFTPGSIPYQQYVTGETPTVVSQFNELGYKTVGMHPYAAAGWNRNNVYDWFGFDETYFLEYFDEWLGYDNEKGEPNFDTLDKFDEFEKIRDYYSDAATYQKIVDLYENKEDDQPLFVFDVTMQNHGSYPSNSTQNLPLDIYTSGIATRDAVNIYLSLINRADAAFGELVDYFAAQDEPTVILMFGDHQPHDTYVKSLGERYNAIPETGSLDEQLRRYTVPFVMWANYDIEEETDVESSINYMSSFLCEKAGIPRTSTQMFLSALSEKYPVVCEGHYSDADGNFYDASTLGLIPEIKQYKMLSYNIITDRSNTLPGIYSYK